MQMFTSGAQERVYYLSAVTDLRTRHEWLFCSTTSNVSSVLLDSTNRSQWRFFVELRVKYRYVDFIIDLGERRAHYIHAGKELARGNAMVRGTSICTRAIVQREVPGPKGVHPNRLPPIQHSSFLLPYWPAQQPNKKPEAGLIYSEGEWTQSNLKGDNVMGF